MDKLITAILFIGIPMALTQLFCIKKGCPRRSSSVGSLIAANKISFINN